MFQSAPGRRRANQVDHRLETDQRLAFPMHADKRKHPVFDLVPFARSRRVVTHRDLQGHLVTEGLQMVFPRPVARAVAAPAVRADQ